MDMVRIRGLRKRFGDKEVLRGLDLTVPENSIFGFIGQNGAGKTTTMKSVLGLLKADGGEIDAISGATVSSVGAMLAVSNAVAIYQEIKPLLLETWK